MDYVHKTAFNNRSGKTISLTTGGRAISRSERNLRFGAKASLFAQKRTCESTQSPADFAVA